ncbi:MAG TPA: prepilin-type N-terminal cleavage/methylation domain-containing protein [Pyrinomonadaceae bacterium]|jgi:prepilin-type N-terminal cleavage/methylation domain-containing protein
MSSFIKPDSVKRSERSPSFHDAAGHTLIEIMIVLAIMGIMLSIALFGMLGHKAAYKADDETLRIINVLREASQLALTQRQPMRVELDATNKTIKIFDENLPGAGDDQLKRIVYLESTSTIREDVAPTGVTAPSPPNYTAATFAGTNPKVWTIWFRRDGTVTDNASPPIPNSSTLYIWQPDPTNTNQAKNKKQVRAITVFGGTGVIRLWKHNGTTFVAS